MIGIFYANVAVSIALTGLIWTVQCVVYPSFVWYQTPRAFADHQRRITYIVGPLMITELILTILITATTPLWQTYASAIILSIIWLQTGLIMVPLHRQLAKKPDSMAICRLIQHNWLRTIGWTIKAALSLAVTALVTL